MLDEPSPYPVIVELLFPFQAEPTSNHFPQDPVFEFRKVEHRALILHAEKIGAENEPTVCLTLVPFAYTNYLDPDEKPLPFADPDPLNMKAQFPAMEQNRSE